MNFHHSAVSARNLEKSTTFYKDVFGFVEVKKFERADLGGKAVLLKLNDYFIEIWQFDNQVENQDDFNNLNVLGYKHIAFQVQDIEKTYTELKAKGIEVTEPKQGAVAKYLFIKDPDGLPIEFLQLPDNFN